MFKREGHYVVPKGLQNGNPMVQHYHLHFVTFLTNHHIAMLSVDFFHNLLTQKYDVNLDIDWGVDFGKGLWS